MDSIQNKQIVRLQDNLSAIRKIAGWTTEDLGNMIGVTKATISNLENKKSSMTLTQYIAIRTVIDHEIQTNAENTVLPQVVSILIDNDDLSEEEQQELSQRVGTIAASASGGISGAALASVFATFVASPILGAATMPLAITGMWLPKILKSRKKQKDKNKEENKNG